MTRLAHLLLTTFVLVLGAHPAASAIAAFTTAPNARSSVETLVLQPPVSAGATTSDGCAHVTVSWPATAHADSYQVEVREGDGAWVDVSADTGPVTSLEDSAGHVATTVAYRVHSRDSSSGWRSAGFVESNQLSC